VAGDCREDAEINEDVPREGTEISILASIVIASANRTSKAATRVH